jgi:hypothetical protein
MRLAEDVIPQDEDKSRETRRDVHPINGWREGWPASQVKSNEHSRNRFHPVPKGIKTQAGIVESVHFYV